MIKTQYAQWQEWSPLVAALSLKAGTLRGSLVPGTSMLGFALKKELGLKVMLRCSTGILNDTESAIRSMKSQNRAYTGQSSGRGI